MKVSLFNERIMFQKNSVVTDSIGNHTNEWKDYYSCAAYVSDNAQSEKESAGVTVTDRTLIFSVRYCSELSSLTADGYRVMFHSYPYNIVSIDTMNYQHRMLKITCEKERRDG